jgi:signal transduction histidine kinase
MMLNNVNDTLDNAQIERGTFSLKDGRCQIKAALQDVVRVIEMQAASKNITIRQMLPSVSLNIDK